MEEISLVDRRNPYSDMEVLYLALQNGDITMQELIQLLERSDI